MSQAPKDIPAPDEHDRRLAWFADESARLSDQARELPSRCPCCGCHTLGDRGRFEISLADQLRREFADLAGILEEAALVGLYRQAGMIRSEGRSLGNGGTAMDEHRGHEQSTPLSRRAMEFLARAGHPGNADTPERVEGQCAAAGLPTFPIVVDTFSRFGGYVIPMGAQGRFTIYRAKQAIRMMRRSKVRDDDPGPFRIPIGESETIQAFFSMNGTGRIYEDERPIADSMALWIEHWAAQGRR